MQPQHNVCYLLHFDEAIGSPSNPRGRAQHYLGHADRLDRRTLEHMRGRGAKITQALVERGIGFSVVRIWPGDRGFERKLKNKKDAPGLCPICSNRTPPPVQEDLL
jgi:putative endonuclease